MNILHHRADAAWPISYDGTVATRSDKWGRPDVKGRYICWEELLPGDSIPRQKIAKLVRHEKKIEPLDTTKMALDLENNPKYDINLRKSKAKMRSRLLSVYNSLGISHLDALNITDITKSVEIACWGSGEKEYIFINPYMIFQPKYRTAFILTHECMHRALYRGRDYLKDKELLNVVLDICINRILSATHTGKPSKQWIKFCQWIYPEESKKNVIALCRADLDDNDLLMLNRINPVYAQIWRELYEPEKGKITLIDKGTGKRRFRQINGMLSFKLKDLNPDDLYFRLKSQLSGSDKKAMQGFKQEGGMNPFGENNSNSISPQDAPSKKIAARVNAYPIAPAASKRAETGLRKYLVPKRFRGIHWQSYSDCRTEFWDKWFKKPEDLYDEDLDKYIRRIKTQKMIEDVTGKVAHDFVNEVLLQPYPYILTEEGITLSFLGFRPPKFPLFWNYDGLQGKKRLVAFFDLSPSTAYYWPYMSRMCEILENTMDFTFARNEIGDPGVYTFAGSIKELNNEEIKEMKSGKLKVGRSTCFDAMVEYCIKQIDTEDIDAVLCFTDGMSRVSEYNKKEFNNSGKSMYNIYFLKDEPHNHGRIINSDLDDLNGESFTLCVPPTDTMGGL